MLRKLLTNRVTWRFLFLLASTCGLTAIAQDLGGLEALVCTVLTCSD